MTQAVLAEAIECTRSHVGMLLGGSLPSLTVAVRIEKKLGIRCPAWFEPAGEAKKAA